MKSKILSIIFFLVMALGFTSCDDDHFNVEQCIITDDGINLTANSASVGGKILCDCGLQVTERGVYWSVSSSPETTGSKFPMGEGIGQFRSELSCLFPNSTYYVKAYAVNSQGTFFGKEKSFTTLPSETFLDTRDGKLYKTIKIGNQIWMAENLNYTMPDNSFCYNNEASNCNQYGRLYYWQEAIEAVPPGWHLPSRSEFDTLISHFSSPQQAYLELNEGGCSGFDSKFSGIRNHESSPEYFGLGTYADYWSTTEQSSDWVWILDLNIVDQKAIIAPDRKNRGFSVRCIKNDLETEVQ